MEHVSTDPHTPPSPKKILVIDDDDSYREIISIALTTMGYEIITASDGLEGLSAAKTRMPDLILCDIGMPNMDGHAVLGALKEDPVLAGIPFIFLTGKGAKGDLRKGMQLGADDYLTKPFTTDELIDAVAARLTKKSSLQKYYESQFEDIKSNILHALPHEFRTPLQGILGFSQFLHEEESIPPVEVKRMAGYIKKAGERLQRLLENMILLGRLQVWANDQYAVAAKRRESTTRLSEGVQSAADKEAVLQNRADSISIAVCDSPVQLSSLHLTKMMEEIIDNALKFSARSTKVFITSEENDTEVEIMIRDEGRGMTHEQIGKVTAFQQFERQFYEQQGAGLGLIIAKTLAEFYGGSLSIESELKKGTTVKIKLLKAKNA